MPTFILISLLSLLISLSSSSNAYSLDFSYDFSSEESSSKISTTKKSSSSSNSSTSIEPSNQKNKKDNPYQNWIQTYGGEEFSKSVTQAIQITNNYALKASDETVQKMNNAFKKSSKLEWMFWESAYNKEQWKI